MNGMNTPSHRETSLAHVAAVVQTAHHIEHLHEGPRVDRAEVAKAYDSIRQGLKIAEIHALLAVAEAVEKSTAPPVGVTMDRCTRANGITCQLHGVDHSRERAGVKL